MSKPPLDSEQPYKIDVEGVEYDLRQLVNIDPLDSEDYWKADLLELTFKGKRVVQVSKDDLDFSTVTMLDQWVDTV